MQVVIMAGGLATRMRPLTDTIPKALLPIVGDKPFLEYQLDLLRTHGLDRVLLCVGHHGEQIEDRFGDGRQHATRTSYAYERGELMGTGGALKCAEDMLDERFFLLWGDSYVRLDYRQMWAEHAADSSRLVTIALHCNRDRYDKSNVLVEEGRVALYDKAGCPGMRHIDAGVSVVEKSVLEKGPATGPYPIEDIFCQLSREGRVAGFNISERFFEIGSHQGLSEMREYAKSLADQEIAGAARKEV